MKTFIVHGLRGCGKTRNREGIAEHLTGDRSRFVEVDEPSLAGSPMCGHVHLTNDLGRAKYRLRQANIDMVEVIAFDDLPIPATHKAA